MLEELKKNIDDRIFTFKKNAILISNETKIQTIVNSDKNNTLETNRYKVYEAVRFSELIRMVNQDIDDVLIYLRSSKKVLFNQTYMNNDFFYNEYVNQDKYPTISKWDNYINQDFDPSLINFEFSKPAGSTNQYLAYISKLPIGTNIGSNANLLLLIKKEKIISYLNNYKLSNDGLVFILDSKNNIIASNSPFDLPDFISYNSVNLPATYVPKDVEVEASCVEPPYGG